MSSKIKLSIVIMLSKTFGGKVYNNLCKVDCEAIFPLFFNLY